MQIFVSWSKGLSHKVARILKKWIPTILDQVEVWISSDISKGSIWFSEVASALKKSEYGIICVVNDNLGKPWLNFEAGAISSSIGRTQVTPFLFCISQSEVKGPLSQFQSTVFEKEDIRKMIYNINDSCKSEGLSRLEIDKRYEKQWPILRSKLNKTSHYLWKQAAAICYRKENGNIYLVLVRSSSNKRWTLPKGHIKKHEAVWDAALREAKDEAGVEGELVLGRPFEYYHMQGKKQKRQQRVAIFLIEVRRISKEKQRESEWFTLKEAQDKLSENRSKIVAKQLGKILKEAERYILRA